MSHKQKDITMHDGFTIVEMLIVLAIAGLILMLVFAVIPVLNRTSRNNQRKQDISTILEAVSHYELIDSGNVPNSCGGAGPSCLISGGTTPNDYFLYPYLSKLTYYSAASQVQMLSRSGSVPSGSVNFNMNSVYITNYQRCDPTMPGHSTYQGAGYNDVVALFAVEEGSSTSPECQQL